MYEAGEVTSNADTYLIESQQYDVQVDVLSNSLHDTLHSTLHHLASLQSLKRSV